MTTSQRYISSELTHFVGRRHRSRRSRQYQTLTYILRDGLLRSGASQAGHLEIRVRPNQKLSSNNAIEPSTVCFCDIPEADFGIHMKKYGVFGISFAKSFLVEKGASPISYIAANSKVAVAHAHLSRHWTGGPIMERGEVFDEHWATSRRLGEWATNEMPNGFSHPTGTETWWELKHLLSGLDTHVFSFTKFFDASLSADHPENWYMEREWRVLWDIPFTLNDINRIILPRSYAKRFRQDFPKYVGQISFSR